MNYKTLIKIDDHFQITLPQEVLQALNIAVGDDLVATIVEDGVLLTPAARGEQPTSGATSDVL